MEASTSQTLLQQAAAGCEDKWVAMWTRYRPLVAAELRRIVQGASDDDCNDILQDVFQVLYLRLPSFERRGPGSFRSFLREITRRQTLTWLRERNRHRVDISVDINSIAVELARWSTAQPSDADPIEIEHQRYWSSKILEEAQTRCQHSEKLKLGFTAFCAVKLQGEVPANVACQLGVSLASVYRMLHQTERVIQAVRAEWAEFLE